MSCKGLCCRFTASMVGGSSFYDRGIRYCRTCEEWVNIGDAVKCPCCKAKVKQRPNKKEYRQRLALPRVG